MKLAKTLGPAATVVLGLMAFFGASSASATVLCTATETPDCTIGLMYGEGTVIDSTLRTLSSAKLTGSSGDTISTCTGSKVKGKLGFPGGAVGTPAGNIENVTWEGCSQTTDTVKPGSLEIHWIAGTHNGTVTGKGSEVTVQIFGVSCTYGTGTGTHLGTLTGGTAPVLAISTTLTKMAGGFLCPGTAGWDAEYTITEPHALYVAESFGP